jgi:hypothetical protein
MRYRSGVRPLVPTDRTTYSIQVFPTPSASLVVPLSLAALFTSRRGSEGASTTGCGPTLTTLMELVPRSNTASSADELRALLKEYGSCGGTPNRILTRSGSLIDPRFRDLSSVMSEVLVLSSGRCISVPALMFSSTCRSSGRATPRRDHGVKWKVRAQAFMSSLERSLGLVWQSMG